MDPFSAFCRTHSNFIEINFNIIITHLFKFC